MTRNDRYLRRMTGDGAAARQLPARRHVALRLIAGLAFMVLLGTILLSLPGMTTRPLGLMERFFTATSAVTVTGLAVTTPSIDFTPLGQVVILLLVQTGGLGFVVMVVLALLLVGRPLTMTHRLALTSEMGLDKPGAVQAILGRTLLVMLSIEAIGTVVLYIYWRARDIVPESSALFFAVFHAVTAFCNAGIDLFAGVSPKGMPSDIGSLFILGVLIILGGLGTPVYMDVLFRGSGRRLSLTSRVTIAAAVFLIAAGMIGLLVGERQPINELARFPWPQRLAIAWFQSVSVRTAGFPALVSFDQLHQASRLLLVVLMFIGSGPASMGGGITTGTFAVLVLAMLSYVRGERRPVVLRRTVSEGTVSRALAVLLVSLGVVGLATWVLLLTQDLELDQALFEVVSAYATVGLSLGVTAALDDFGRLLIAVVMFWGRLGAMTIMIALLQRRADSELISYPEESLLVG